METRLPEKVVVEFSKQEALVLLEMLAGFLDGDHLPVRDEAERLALWRLEGLLEKRLVEPFQENYLELVIAAKQHLIEGYIGKEEVEKVD